MTRINAYLGAFEAKRVRRREYFYLWCEIWSVGINVIIWANVAYEAAELALLLR